MNTITVGVLGLGRAGWGIHVANLRNDPRFNITAVVDPSDERRCYAAKELNCTAFPTLEGLLSAGKPDLVIVANPNPLHEADAITVLESGCHCIVEKPFSLTYAGAVRMEDAAKRANKLLTVNHRQIFLKEYQFLRKIVDSNILGDIFEIRFNWARYGRRNDWQTLKKNGGGHLNNHGPHALSLMLGLLGAPVDSLSAVVRHVKDSGDADDHVHMLVGCSNGRYGDIFLSTACALPLPKYCVLGSAGTMILDADGQARLRYFNQQELPPLPVVDGPASGDKYAEIPWSEEVHSLQSDPKPPSIYDNVYAAITDNTPLVVTPESAVEVIRAIEWAHSGHDPKP